MNDVSSGRRRLWGVTSSHPVWMGAAMTAPSHAEVLAAIDKARRPQPVPEHRPCACHDQADDRNNHCDDLRALMDLHHPTTCLAECADPCPAVQVVIDRLKGWGVL